MRGGVLLLQGRGEFLEKHAPLIDEIAAWGYAVTAFDWRGQGRSARLLADPGPGHIRDFAQYLDDLDAVLAHATAQGWPAPERVLAHSMGGHIALLAIARGRLQPRTAVLTAPMLDIRLGLPRWAARGAAATGARLRRGGWAPGQGPWQAARPFQGNPLTTDPARYAAWVALCEAHPACRLGGVTYGWVDAALRSIAALRRPGVLERIGTPVLLLRAMDDVIVDNRAIATAARRLPNARLLDFHGARHELLLEQDPVRDATLAAIRDAFAAV